MLPDRSRQGLWRSIALGILLCYPIMVVKWFPFGGGARYLNVLAAPVCLILLWQAPRGDIRQLLNSALRWGMPFLPFVLVWTFAQLWHGYDPLDLVPPTRLLWCALLFLGARLAGVAYRHLAFAAAIGAVAYCGVALVEVYGLGRPRAWGGTYENRFGQFSIWVASLCFLHVFLDKSIRESRSLRALLPLAGILGGVACWLSGSRGALLALLVLMAIILHGAKNRRQGLPVAFAMALAVLAFCVYYEPMSERLDLTFREAKAYFSEAEFSPTSIGIRLELFRLAYLTFLDDPVVGPGYTSLVQLYKTHPAFGVPLPEMLEIPGFHNDWSQTIGIGGGLLFISLIGTCLWMFRSARGNSYQLAFLGFALMFSFSEIFFTNKMGLSLLMATWALYAAAEQNQERSA